MRRRSFVSSVAAFGGAAVWAPSRVLADSTMCQNAVALSGRPDIRPLTPRLPIRSLSATEIGRLRTAYQNMIDWGKANPGDPRGFDYQAQIHHDAGMRGMTEAAYRIHGSYYFLPWHRTYLYFNERILAWHLTGRHSLDPTFRLPVWDWENEKPDASLPAQNRFISIPVPYTSGALDHDRSGFRLPFSSASLVSMSDAINWDDGDFFGRSDADGSLASGPHGNVHEMSGGDMMDIRTSAKDPLFFAHHANVDKGWAEWAAADAKHIPPVYPSSTAWMFTDWDGACVLVHPADVADNAGKLRYDYRSTVAATPPVSLEAAHIGAAALFLSPQTLVRLREQPPIKSVGVALRNVAIPGSGHFEVLLTVGTVKDKPIGSFSVLQHEDVRKTDAFLTMDKATAELATSPGAKLSLRSTLVQRDELVATGVPGSNTAPPTEFFTNHQVQVQELRATGAALKL